MQAQEFTQRVRARERKLFRIAYSILYNEADCADAIQEALLKAWRGIDLLRDERFFDTWLVRVLINECYTLIRRSKRMLPVRESEPPVPHPELRDALLALPNKLRLPIILHYNEGYGTREIAAILKIPEGTVKTRLVRARQMLKKELESEVDRL